MFVKYNFIRKLINTSQRVSRSLKQNNVGSPKVRMICYNSPNMV